MTIDTSRTLEIAGSRAKLALLALAGVLMIGLSATIALRLIPHMPSSAVLEAMGWCGVVFFGLCLAVILKRLAQKPGPIVTITRDGIRDTRVSADFIPWPAVQRIFTWASAGQKVMVLTVEPAVESRLRLTAIARWSRKPNRMLGADGLCVTAQGLDIDYDTLFATSTAYAEAAKRRGR